MGNPNKAKGTRWETAIVRVSNAFFRGRFNARAYRPAQTGQLDTGDVHGVSPFVFQAKDDRSFKISEWLDGPRGVVVQAKRAGEPYGAVVVKRVRRGVGDAYAIVRYQDLARVIMRLRRAEALLERADPDSYLWHAKETTREVDEPFPKESDLST